MQKPPKLIQYANRIWSLEMGSTTKQAVSRYARGSAINGLMVRWNETFWYYVETDRLVINPALIVRTFKGKG